MPGEFIKLRVLEIGSDLDEANDIRVRKDKIIFYQPMTVRFKRDLFKRVFDNTFNALKTQALVEKNNHLPPAAVIETLFSRGVDFTLPGDEWKEESEVTLISLTPMEEKNVKSEAARLTRGRIPGNIGDTTLVVIRDLHSEGSHDQMYTITPIEEIDNILF